ncbi:hypothetical protein, partial [Vibrio sp. V17_P4S1T151]|uniref:hypothetical protein n=1 Tax=Vibrio sp. V17_P4S1T151 TaxID=1938670 RepID=UPI001C3D94F2
IINKNGLGKYFSYKKADWLIGNFQLHVSPVCEVFPEIILIMLALQLKSSKLIFWLPVCSPTNCRRSVLISMPQDYITMTFWLLIINTYLC